MFEKRTETVLNHFVLDRDAVVETREGEQVVRSGDWVMEGVAGEVWPALRAKARKTFERL